MIRQLRTISNISRLFPSVIRSWTSASINMHRSIHCIPYVNHQPLLTDFIRPYRPPSILSLSSTMTFFHLPRANAISGRTMSSMPRQNKKSRRGPMVERIRKEAATRWLPTAKGNLKRQRCGWGHNRSLKSRRQRSRMNKTVYATRSQLRKLKKILPHGYVKTLKI